MTSVSSGPVMATMATASSSCNAMAFVSVPASALITIVVTSAVIGVPISDETVGPTKEGAKGAYGMVTSPTPLASPPGATIDVGTPDKTTGVSTKKAGNNAAGAVSTIRSTVTTGYSDGGGVLIPSTITFVTSFAHKCSYTCCEISSSTRAMLTGATNSSFRGGFITCVVSASGAELNDSRS